MADEIPNAFHGQWGVSAAVCGSKGPEADTIVTVGRKGYQGYEISCQIKKIKTSSPTVLIASGSCDEEGESSPTTIKMELLSGGKGLKIGEEKYVKCGNK